VLQQTALADDFAYRVDRSGLGSGGVAIWSTDPVVVAEHPATTNESLDLTVDGPDGPVRIIGVHPPTPIMNFGAWRRDLARFGELGQVGDTPTVVVGDFNASFWHPDFRSLLDDGYTDAHLAAGRGLSTSWPTDRWYPPFVRLDHALTTDSLVSTDVEDFEIVGSDHEGFVVTVAPAR
jgi:endonuclease/exonuclease/phosphatase family metal-dependent hydrolase